MINLKPICICRKYNFSSSTYGKNNAPSLSSLFLLPRLPEAWRVDKCSASTIPYINQSISNAKVEHEATTSKISEDQLFYCLQRGLDPETATSLIVNGFCKEVMKELPMEFAVEAQKLIGISLEGSVG